MLIAKIEFVRLLLINIYLHSHNNDILTCIYAEKVHNPSNVWCLSGILIDVLMLTSIFCTHLLHAYFHQTLRFILHHSTLVDIASNLLMFQKFFPEFRMWRRFFSITFSIQTDTVGNEILFWVGRDFQCIWSGGSKVLTTYVFVPWTLAQLTRIKWFWFMVEHIWEPQMGHNNM